MIIENINPKTMLTNFKNEKLLNSLLDFINNENEKDKNTKKNYNICPFCKSSSIVSNGNYKGRKRFRCNICKKSYNDFTGTIFSHIQDMDKLNEFTRLLLLGKTTQQLSKELNISKNTSIIWKRKILNSLTKESSIK